MSMFSYMMLAAPAGNEMPLSSSKRPACSIAPRMPAVSDIIDPIIEPNAGNYLGTAFQENGDIRFLHRTKWLDTGSSLIDLIWDSSLVKKDGKQQAGEPCSHDDNVRIFAIALGRKLGRKLDWGVIKLVNRLAGTMRVHGE